MVVPFLQNIFFSSAKQQAQADAQVFVQAFANKQGKDHISILHQVLQSYHSTVRASMQQAIAQTAKELGSSGDADFDAIAKALTGQTVLQAEKVVAKQQSATQVVSHITVIMGSYAALMRKLSMKGSVVDPEFVQRVESISLLFAGFVGEISHVDKAQIISWLKDRSADAHRRSMKVNEQLLLHAAKKLS